jgi:excisionase family DNA binding protein
MYDLRSWTGIRSICRTLNVSKNTLLEWIREHKFPARRVMGKGAYRVIPDEYFEWLKTHGEQVSSEDGLVVA